MQSWIHLLEHRAARHPHIEAIRDDLGTSLEYFELLERVERTAGGWAERGVEPGDRVAIVMSNSVEYLVQVLALNRAGALPVLINWRLSPAEVLGLVDLFEPTAAAISPAFTDLVAPAGLGLVMTEAPGAADSLATLDAVPPPRPVERLLGSAPFAVIHTSGTTGLPKGVPLQQATMILGGLINNARMGDPAPGRKHLRVMPMFHLAGLGGALQGFFGAHTTILHSKFDPAAWLDTIEAEGVSYSNAGPSLMRRILDEQERRPRDLSSLVEIWYGTESMPPDVLERALRLIGCKFRQNYGMTEAQRPVSQLEPDDHTPDSPHLNTAGRIMPGYEVRIVDPAGRDVAEGMSGELWIRADTMFPGYWNNAEATARAFVGPAQPAGLGWYRTGDVCSLTDGYLKVHDRVDDMIVTGGENVYAGEVETILRAHPSVHDVVVVGVKSERWGETVHAAVVASDEVFDGDELIAFSRERLAHFKCPTGVTVIDEIPRNATGKALRRVVREQVS